MAAISLPPVAGPVSRPPRLHPFSLPTRPNSLRCLSFCRTHFSVSNHTETLHLHPSKTTTKDYCNLLHLSVQNDDTELAMAIHASILKLQHNDPYFFNALILAYFKLGLTGHAQKVFNCVNNPDVVTYTSVISWFAKSNREIEALKVFFEMRKLGVEPNEYSFVAVLTACGRVLDLELGCQIHSLAIKMGYVDDTYVSNALMGFYSKCGCLDCVLKVFDEMSQRNISSWNTVISGLVKEYNYEKAIELFHDLLRTDGLQTDHFTLSTVLTACTEHAAVMKGRELHAHALKFRLETNVSVNNALIRFYSKCGSIKDVEYLFDTTPVKDVITWTQMISIYMESGHLETAQKVFDKMPERNCVSYNTLLQGFCHNGVPSRALYMFCRMVEDGLELDDFSMTIIINACGLHADKNTSKQIHGFVLKSGFGSNDRIESALLDMCTKCERITDAEAMFHRKSTKNSITWTSMVSGYARNGLPYEALSVFFDGQAQQHIIIDEIVSTTVLGICSTLGLDKTGEQIHCSSFKFDLLHDIMVGNALIGMYSKCGNMTAAVTVFDTMNRHDIGSWNSLIGGYVFHKQGDKALNVWKYMKRKSMIPNSTTILLIISAYTHTALNMVTECRTFFRSIKTMYNIEPDLNHYTSMVTVYGKWGLLEEAESIIKKMPYEPNPLIWRALLDSCRVHSNMVIGNRAAKEILAKKPNDPSMYILVSNLYSASGRWHCSEMTREEMRENGFQKRPGKSWIVHENKVHSFYARDKSHACFKDVYSALDILVLECLKIGYVPDTSFVLHEVEEHQKRDFLYYHSAKLAVTYGLLMTRGRMPVRVMKNIHLCGDCHSFFKFVSVVTKREIHIRDASGFHCFVNGECTCTGL